MDKEITDLLKLRTKEGEAFICAQFLTAHVVLALLIFVSDWMKVCPSQHLYSSRIYCWQVSCCVR